MRINIRLKCGVLFVALLNLFLLSESSLAAKKGLREFKIHVTGVDSKIARRIMKDDLMYHIRVKVHFEPKKNRLVPVYVDARLDNANQYFNPQTGLYRIDQTYTVLVKEKDFFFDRPVTLLIKVDTQFGNVIWARKTRKLENIADPIMFDHYSLAVPEKGQSESKPRKGLLFRGSDFIADIKNGFIGDDGVLMSGENFRMRLKNEGDRAWKIREMFSKKNAQNGNIGATYIDFKGTDLTVSKPLILQAGLKTWYGNWVWCEWRSIIKPAFSRLNWKDNLAKKGTERVNMSNSFRFTHYSGAVGDAQAALMTEPPQGSLNAGGSKSRAVVGVGGMGGVGSAGRQSDNRVYLSHHKANLLFNPARIVKSATPNGAAPIMGSQSRILAESAKITVARMPFTLKAGTSVTFDAGRGYLTKAILDGDQVIESPFGSLHLAGNMPIGLDMNTITGVTLAEASIINTPVGKLVAEAKGDRRNFDIVFGRKGMVRVTPVIKEITLGKGSTIPVGDAVLEAAKGVTLHFHKESLERISGEQTVSVNLSGQRFEAAGLRRKDVIVWLDRKNNSIKMLRAASGQSVRVGDISFPVKPDSKVKFEFKEGVYHVKKFAIAETMEVELVKKGKVKIKKAKAGRKLTISDGKIVKISRF